MDGAFRLHRRYSWWCCLLCIAVFVSSADAATRRYPPNLPTAQQVGTGGVPTTTTATTYTVEMEGVDYIPGDNSHSSKGTKLPVKSEVPFVKQRTWNMAKGVIGKIGKGGAIGIGASIAIDMMLDNIGAVMDQGELKRIKPGEAPPTSVFWCAQSVKTNCSATATGSEKYLFILGDTPSVVADAFVQRYTNSSEYAVIDGYTRITSNRVNIQYRRISRSTGQAYDTGFIPAYRHNECPTDTVYNESTFKCHKTQLLPLDDSDYALMEAFANAQNSAWLQGLLKDVCSASLNPAACFNDMAGEGRKLSGPPTLAGPSKTTSSTYTDPNGVSQQVTTTQAITYNITSYGSNYYDYSKTITTTKTGTDGSSETTTETETPVVTDEDKPQDDPQEEQEQVAAVPCSGSSCDGPAYEDQYQPTEQTKEDHIDSYVDRISSIPIIQAVGNLFDITAGGSCPVWTFNHQLEIGGFSTNINLVFDYLCQPWFTQYGPWIRAVIYLVAVYAAIRVALL